MEKCFVCHSGLAGLGGAGDTSSLSEHGAGSWPQSVRLGLTNIRVRKGP